MLQKSSRFLKHFLSTLKSPSNPKFLPTQTVVFLEPRSVQRLAEVRVILNVGNFIRFSAVKLAATITDIAGHLVSTIVVIT